ncbi:EAL domain-containing protein [Arthrobacter sp. OV608]|uniref:EAL domain-containing protein n=1 Tax=Arthrobacter sp. OV608 TaxID=1882768 RepID=UPI0008C44C46|nr:EAL domain-containing protein [Arthrobacter sp. OV608]SEP85432.1 EAL domain, c-di-GMP-specific phosphodiesterase class I (or its enzymatically inactive variant) [Arthrobacter sp. OV608]
MSRDEFALPAFTGAEEMPGLGGPDSTPQAAENISLRSQVMELIDDVLSDPDPAGEWARVQLRKLLASYPDNPERAFLEHLIGTRKHGTGQQSLPGGAGRAPAGRLVIHGTQDPGMTKRIESVLGSRLLLTAFQPIHELTEGRVAGVEALTRFVSSDGADADIWFREADAVGLGLELEIAALQCAVAAGRMVPSHLFVAFNLTPATLIETRVQDLLQNSGLAMDKIVIELRGQATDKQWDWIIRWVKPLRRMGLRVAVDGSGSGFTPAERILSLQPDIIKLDRTFIDGILEGPDPDEPAVVGLAREVGAVLAAEGIETQTELAAVIDAGLTAGQGYLMGRPSVHPLDWSSWVIQPNAGVTVET